MIDHMVSDAGVEWIGQQLSELHKQGDQLDFSNWEMWAEEADELLSMGKEPILEIPAKDCVLGSEYYIEIPEKFIEIVE